MKELIKKWWFWLALVFIIIIIAVTSIILLGLNIINPDKNLTKLSRELQDYDNSITVYQSAGKNIILVNSYSINQEQATQKAEEIGKILAKYIEYLTVYSDVQFNFYTEEGGKTSFKYNIATQNIEEEGFEDWVLTDSIAYNKEETKVKELQSEQEKLSSEISNLEKRKEELNTQINNLNSEVIKLKGEPKTYPAGHLTVGTDLPTGKYKIYGGSSNFIVYSSTGRLEVNIILGGKYGVSEYIYTFKSGDKIEANSSFKLVPVE